MEYNEVMLFIKWINFSFWKRCFAQYSEDTWWFLKESFKKIFHKKYLLRKVNNLIIFSISYFYLSSFALLEKNWKIIFLSVLLVRFIFDLCYTHPLLNLIKLTKKTFFLAIINRNKEAMGCLIISFNQQSYVEKFTGIINNDDQVDDFLIELIREGMSLSYPTSYCPEKFSVS